MDHPWAMTPCEPYMRVDPEHIYAIYMLAYVQLLMHVNN